MKIQILSIVFAERKAVDFKDKNAGYEGKIIRKKPPSLARLSGNPTAFLPANQLAYSARKQPQMRRSAVELRRSHSFIPLKAASIPAGCYEELTQKTEPKIVETSSVFFETDDIFRAGIAKTHLQKQGTAVSEPSNNLRFLIKKSGEHAAGNA